MSGTYAVLSFHVAARDEFERASKVSLNGVPAFVGPCPKRTLWGGDRDVKNHHDNVLR
jgi:uncharacterized protein (DUF39 family)